MTSLSRHRVRFNQYALYNQLSEPICLLKFRLCRSCAADQSVYKCIG
uniref:5.06 kDa protein n=1 Tax=Tobacco mild green mosaic virus TaxID=12241 RepID=A0A517BB95_TMGMV|nr:5.06 kDa protein [Tobacco mild green mosaic virus]QDR49929.1 5.06 kDa protein [Tobacco mild green mosaic virus]